MDTVLRVIGLFTLTAISILFIFGFLSEVKRHHDKKQKDREVAKRFWEQHEK